MAPAVLDASSDGGGDSMAMDIEPSEVRLGVSRRQSDSPQECQVCVVGAGPAGLMTATNLARMGIKVQVVDDREDPTPVGR